MESPRLSRREQPRRWRRSKGGGSHDEPVDTAEAVARWRLWLEGQGDSPDTIRLYSTGVTRLLMEYVGGPPERTTDQHVAAFLKSLGKHAPARSKYLLGIRSAFGYWLRHGNRGRGPQRRLQGTPGGQAAEGAPGPR